MSKFSLLVMGGALGLLCAGSPAVLAQVAPPAGPKTNVGETKPPFKIPNGGNFKYKGKSSQGEFLLMEVKWQAAGTHPNGTIRISGDVKYKNSKTEKIDDRFIDGNKSYITKDGKLFFALNDVDGKVYGPVDLVELESKRLESKTLDKSDKKTANTSNASFNEDLKTPPVEDQQASAEDVKRLDALIESDLSSTGQDLGDIFVDDDTGNASTNSLSNKKITYPKFGSFDTVVLSGKNGLLPLSVSWEVNGKINNGNAKIKGYIFYIYQGKLVSYALDVNKSYMKNGRIYFAARVLEGTFQSPTKVNTNQNRVIAIQRAVKKILKNGKNQPPSLKKPYHDVDPLSGALYNAMLNYGIESIKYGRSVYSGQIRNELTKALDPKNTGWAMSQRVSSVLNQLGTNVNRGTRLKVALRPIEKGAEKKAIDRTQPFLVVGVDEIANVIDLPIDRFFGRANVAYDRLGQNATAQAVLIELGGLNAQQRLVADAVADALGRPGILAVAGLNDDRRQRLANQILDFWRNRITRREMAIHLMLYMNLNDRRANEAANLIIGRLQQAPVRDIANARLNIVMMIGIHHAAQAIPGAGSFNLGMSSLSADRSRRDEL